MVPSFVLQHIRCYDIVTSQVAENNHAALKSFFKMYSQYANNEFYLTGESYAGIYVPTLANVVMEDSSINFKVGFFFG